VPTHDTSGSLNRLKPIQNSSFAEVLAKSVVDAVDSEALLDFCEQSRESMNPRDEFAVWSE
jgi:hypothetical protein